MSGLANTGGAPVGLQGVTVFYGEVVGLSNVSLELEPGITGIVGPNGSGKTTLMRVLTGLIDPAEGEARVLGRSPFTDPEVRRRISFVPATECFYEGLSGKRNLDVAFLSHGYGTDETRRLTARALELIGLEEHAGRRYGTWSRGMRQRLKLGLTLVSDSDVVLFDEPFLGVDPPSRRFLRVLIQKIGESGRTVLVSSHVLHEIEALTDRVGVLAHGRLLGFGKIEALLKELRDRHPHRIQAQVDEPRRLAGELMSLPHVRELKIVDAHTLEWVTEEPENAYRELPGVVIRCGVLVRQLVTVDNTLEAVFKSVTEAGAKRL